MRFDVLTETAALIEAGAAEPVRGLGDRDFVPLAADVVGDIAVSMFAVRDGDGMERLVNVLVLRDGTWFLIGAGGHTGSTDLLADRPTWLRESALRLPDSPVSSDSRVISTSGSGGSLDDPGDELESARWISYAVVRVCASVVSLEVAGRTLSVPWHGCVPVVWAEEHAPTVVARSATVERLADLRLV